MKRNRNLKYRTKKKELYELKRELKQVEIDIAEVRSKTEDGGREDLSHTV